MTDDFLTLDQAARRLGLSDATLRRRITAGEFTVYRNPRDRRTKLVRVKDVEDYDVPRPVGAGGKEAPRPDAAA